jgi:hypothetical protein
MMPGLSHAQAICIPETVTVTQIRGQVFFGFEGNRRPQPGVTIEVLRDKGVRKLVSSTTSDAEGLFSFKGIRPGHYILRTKHSQIIGLDVRLNVEAPHKKLRNPSVLFVLGADPLKPCGGGFVEVAPSTKSSSQLERGATVNQGWTASSTDTSNSQIRSPYNSAATPKLA